MINPIVINTVTIIRIILSILYPSAAFTLPIIAANVSVPVIASGGAGTKEHFYDALTVGGADAALAASLFHYKELEIRELKRYLRERGLPMRL